MNQFQFDQKKLFDDFANLLLHFLTDGYSNKRFELNDIKEIAQTFSKQPTLILQPQSATTDPELQNDFLIILKHAQTIQIREYTKNLLGQIKSEQQLNWLNQQLKSLIDFINSPPYSENTPV